MQGTRWPRRFAPFLDGRRGYIAGLGSMLVGVRSGMVGGLCDVGSRGAVSVGRFHSFRDDEYPSRGSPCRVGWQCRIGRGRRANHRFRRLGGCHRIAWVAATQRWRCCHDYGDRVVRISRAIPVNDRGRLADPPGESVEVAIRTW